MKTSKDKVFKYKGKDLKPGEDNIKISKKRRPVVAKKSAKKVCKKVAKKVW